MYRIRVHVYKHTYLFIISHKIKSFKHFTVVSFAFLTTKNVLFGQLTHRHVTIVFGNPCFCTKFVILDTKNTFFLKRQISLVYRFSVQSGEIFIIRENSSTLKPKNVWFPFSFFLLHASVSRLVVGLILQVSATR